MHFIIFHQTILSKDEERVKMNQVGNLVIACMLCMWESLGTSDLNIHTTERKIDDSVIVDPFNISSSALYRIAI